MGERLSTPSRRRSPDPEGVNFSLFSESATGVELLLFRRHDDPNPFQTIQLDPYLNKTFHFWLTSLATARSPR